MESMGTMESRKPRNVLDFQQICDMWKHFYTQGATGSNPVAPTQFASIEPLRIRWCMTFPEQCCHPNALLVDHLFFSNLSHGKTDHPKQEAIVLVE
jgi:hypothetical protein